MIVFTLLTTTAKDLPLWQKFVLLKGFCNFESFRYCVGDQFLNFYWSVLIIMFQLFYVTKGFLSSFGITDLSYAIICFHGLLANLTKYSALSLHTSLFLSISIPRKFWLSFYLEKILLNTLDCWHFSLVLLNTILRGKWMSCDVLWLFINFHITPSQNLLVTDKIFFTYFMLPVNEIILVS